MRDHKIKIIWMKFFIQLNKRLCECSKLGVKTQLGIKNNK